MMSQWLIFFLPLATASMLKRSKYCQT
jgi:hypothetical protein